MHIVVTSSRGLKGASYSLFTLCLSVALSTRPLGLHRDVGHHCIYSGCCAVLLHLISIRQLFVSVQSVREVHAPYPTVSMNLKKKRNRRKEGAKNAAVFSQICQRLPLFSPSPRIWFQTTHAWLLPSWYWRVQRKKKVLWGQNLNIFLLSSFLWRWLERFADGWFFHQSPENGQKQKRWIFTILPIADDTVKFGCLTILIQQNWTLTVRGSQTWLVCELTVILQPNSSPVFFINRFNIGCLMLSLSLESGGHVI